MKWLVISDTDGTLVQLADCFVVGKPLQARAGLRLQPLVEGPLKGAIVGKGWPAVMLRPAQLSRPH